MRSSHVPSAFEHKKRGCRSPRVRIKTASCYRTLSCDLLFISARPLPSPHAPFGRSPLYFLPRMIAHELPKVKQNRTLGFQYNFWRHCAGSLFSRSLILGCMDVCRCIFQYILMNSGGFWWILLGSGGFRQASGKQSLSAVPPTIYHSRVLCRKQAVSLRPVHRASQNNSIRSLSLRDLALLNLQ